MDVQRHRAGETRENERRVASGVGSARAGTRVQACAAQ